MKSICKLFRSVSFPVVILFVLCQLHFSPGKAQVCATPNTIIYGLTGTGAIYPINVNTAVVGAVIRNTTYPGNPVIKANGLSYNPTNGRFYYFKRNVGSAPQEFAMYDPGLALVTVLANSTCAGEVHTGAVNATGLAYYTIDINANLNYYNVLRNTWTYIGNNFVDQYGANVTAVITSQSAGDIAFDGLGNLWIVTSSATNYGLYRMMGPMPTTPKATINVERVINPTRATPNGNQIAGIAFNPAGNIFMSTRIDDRLYRMNFDLTTTLIGTMSVPDLGNDLTSCAFPFSVLPLKWVNYEASKLSNNRVSLDWEVAEENSTGFFVQHSTNSTDWTDITYLEAGNNRNESQRYSYIHYNPAAGKNYYRIKMIGEGTTESYTEVKVVTFQPTNENASFSIWPNPASDKIQFSANVGSGMLKVIVYDLAGKIQIEKQLNGKESALSISSLKSGIYIMSVSIPGGESWNQKFIKQ